MYIHSYYSKRYVHKTFAIPHPTRFPVKHIHTYVNQDQNSSLYGSGEIFYKVIYILKSLSLTVPKLIPKSFASPEMESEKVHIEKAKCTFKDLRTKDLVRQINGTEVDSNEKQNFNKL